MASTAVALLAEELRRGRTGVVEFSQVVETHALEIRESTGPAPRSPG
jgi:hypothetical protein